MKFTIPVLVAQDGRGVCELLVPGIPGVKRFRGQSRARLLDDLALDLMERVPKLPPETIPLLELCPLVELRKPKLDLRTGDRKSRRSIFAGRTSVVTFKFPERAHYLFTLPRLSPEFFACTSLGSLDEVVSELLLHQFESAAVDDLSLIECAETETLELLDFETDLPTILPSQPKVLGARKREDPKPPVESTQRKLVTPATLREVASNLTHRAMDGRIGRAFSRNAIVADVLEQLELGRGAVLLVGPRGVGKTAIVHEVVRRLSLSANLLERTDVWEVDANRIIAGMSMVGAWERRAASMVSELSARKDILYVDDLPALVFAGRSAHGNTNIAQYLEPALGRREIRVVGECTPERLAALRDEAPGFFAKFATLAVSELDEKDSLLTLARAARALGDDDDVQVPFDALETILGLTARFPNGERNPGRSVRLLMRVLADHDGSDVDSSRDELGRKLVGPSQITDLFARQTGLPEYVLDESKGRPFESILEMVSSHVVGQPDASLAIADAVVMLEQGLSDPGRPISVFFFAGPTGVGKTETAKTLAAVLFGDASKMVRLDMSEFMSPVSVARLFGDHAHADGELTRAIRDRPFSVVLFDEIEKAHPTVFDALLQIMGEGRLTNAAGQTIDFTNTVIIMTSNLGARRSGLRLGFGEPDRKDVALHFQRAVEDFFRPEFVNRIDRIVQFGFLQMDDIVPLVGRLVENMLSRRGLLRRRVVVDVDPKVVETLVHEGFDERYGARAIKRSLERHLAVPLATHLAGERPDALVVCEIFPGPEGLGVRLHRPPRPEVASTTNARTPSSWPELERGFSDLMSIFQKVQSSDRAQSLDVQRSRLTSDFGAGVLEAGAALEIVNGMVEDLIDLEDRFEEVTRTYFEVDAFEEIPDAQPKEIVRNPWRKSDRRPVETPRFMPRSLDRTGELIEARKVLRDLELRLAGTTHRLGTVHSREDDSIVLSFRKLGSGTNAWISELATAFTRCFDVDREQRTAAVAAFVRSQGVWTASVAVDPQTCDAVVLEIRAPGVRRLALDELGLHVRYQSLGPLQLTSAVLVESIDDGWAQLDDGLLMRIQRRAWTRSIPETLALRREYGDAPSVDLETGVTIHSGESLADDLREVILTRILQRVRGDTHG